MAERIVIFRVGESLFSVPFSFVDEIVSWEKVQPAEDVPDISDASRDASGVWVGAKGRWFPLRDLFSEEVSPEGQQVLLIRTQGESIAYSIDQVVGIESLDEAADFPMPASRLTDFRFSGARVWKGRIVLELDLSGLI